MKTTLIIRTLKNEDDLKIENNLKNWGDQNSNDNLRNEDDIKKEVCLKKEDYTSKIGPPLKKFYLSLPLNLHEIFVDDFSPWQPHHNWC